MRHHVVLVAALASASVAAAIPRAAFAHEPAGAVQGPVSVASLPESEQEFLHRPQIIVFGDVGDNGVGAGVGIRYRWVELGGAGDTTVDDGRGFVALKLFAIPDATYSPYVYGHAGYWGHSEFFGPHDSGDYRSAGLGMDVHTSRHSFLFLELGYGAQTGAVEHPEFNGRSPEMQLGVGLRL